MLIATNYVKKYLRQKIQFFQEQFSAYMIQLITTPIPPRFVYGWK
jgi:hypothetical protein